MMLEAKNIHLQLDGHSVLDDVSLTVNSGELIGLIGPNGAGKSSLLRVLAGLRSPDSGAIALTSSSGETQNMMAISLRERARNIAYLAQQEKPAWPLAVEHLVGLGRAPWRKPMGYKSAVDLDAIEHALQLTDLAELRHRPVTQLSGGELQRCLLARIFAGQPRIILADEPIAALDPYHQLHIMELLQAHATQQTAQGGAVLVALHDLSLAARYCHRLILLNHGRVVANDRPAVVLSVENLQQVYGIDAHIDCREDGVVIIPRLRLPQAG